eukprot:5604400-Pyramimonas_sp.AAC.1
MHWHIEVAPNNGQGRHNAPSASNVLAAGRGMHWGAPNVQPNNRGALSPSAHHWDADELTEDCGTPLGWANGGANNFASPERADTMAGLPWLFRVQLADHFRGFAR